MQVTGDFFNLVAAVPLRDPSVVVFHIRFMVEVEHHSGTIMHWAYFQNVELPRTGTLDWAYDGLVATIEEVTNRAKLGLMKHGSRGLKHFKRVTLLPWKPRIGGYRFEGDMEVRRLWLKHST